MSETQTGNNNKEEWTTFAPSLLKLARDGPGIISVQSMVKTAHSLSPFTSALTILDIGCGPGQITNELLTAYGSAEEIGKGNKLWEKVEMVECDARDLTAFEDGSQFYNSTAQTDTGGLCIPFYPSGLSSVNGKVNGLDPDFDAIESSFIITCSSAGIPFNSNVDIGQPGFGTTTADLPNTNFSIDTNPDVILPASLTLQSSLNLGPLRRDVDDNSYVDEPPVITATARPTPNLRFPARGVSQKHKQEAPAITAAPHLILPEKKSTRAVPKKEKNLKREKQEPVLNRRVEKRAEQLHQWCEENKLVISEFSAHSALEVCESESP
ncbi:hypothetical protein G7Y89_g8907 [Cudoniella acicularis]|uniref:Methyltransferase domain-containing protein n=1 Tax=Cudoniella acicularis TaxID=354080 RepID=A0A8H4W338_9HELO|nr:hypothetical protein G7Y89_g8907 [Cudoniella acicularis]